MGFAKYSVPEGEHALLGASKFHWINYDEERLIDYYYKSLAVERGKEIHAFAASCITLGQRLPKTKTTLNMYVNDAIGFGMKPEQRLFYSEFCFGTADAISYSKRKKLLRIHDLKTGQNPGHMEQLEVYASLFCLQEHMRPDEMSMELRIYQNDEILIYIPDPDRISEIMNKAVAFNKLLAQLKSKGVLM